MAVDNRMLVKWPKYPHFGEVQGIEQIQTSILQIVEAVTRLLACSFKLPDSASKSSKSIER